MGSSKGSLAKTILVNLSVLAAITLFLALIAEVIIRFAAPQPVDYFAFPETAVPGAVFRTFDTTIRFNSYGIRDKEYRKTKRPNVFRIATIGDSITFGFGVELKDTYHKVLESLLNQRNIGVRYEVPTFSHGAKDTAWAVQVYEKVARRFKPDLVILGFCLNDLRNYDEVYGADADPHELVEAVPVHIRMINGARTIHDFLRSHSHLYFLVAERSRRLFYKYVADIRIKDPETFLSLEPENPLYNSAMKSTIDELVGFNRIVTRDGARLVIVIFPYEMQLSPEHVEIYEREYGLTGYRDAPLGRTQRKIVSELKARGIESIDLLESFQRYAKTNPDTQLFFRTMGGMLDFCHPNEVGHRVAAEAIAKRLTGTYLARKREKNPGK